MTTPAQITEIIPDHTPDPRTCKPRKIVGTKPKREKDPRMVREIRAATRGPGDVKHAGIPGIRTHGAILVANGAHCPILHATKFKLSLFIIKKFR